MMKCVRAFWVKTLARMRFIPEDLSMVRPKDYSENVGISGEFYDILQLFTVRTLLCEKIGVWCNELAQITKRPDGYLNSYKILPIKICNTRARREYLSKEVSHRAASAGTRFHEQFGCTPKEYARKK